MAWTKITCPHYERNGQRYASDMTDTEWDIVAPYMPPARRTGRPRTTDLRDVSGECCQTIFLRFHQARNTLDCKELISLN